MTRSNAEYYNMFFVFAQCEGNAEEAARRYGALHPGGHSPTANCFRRLAGRLFSNGSFLPTHLDGGRSSRISTTRADEVLEHVDRNGTVSVRDISHSLGVSRSSVHRILRGHSLHPYRYVRVQNLLPTDYVQRMEYSRWLLREVARNPSFCRFVLWTDEAVFTREGCFNGNNSHVWSDENPHAIRPRALQRRWSINLWAGICDEFVVGPYILPDRFDGPAYNVFLRHVLPTLLEEIPLEVRKNMYFQHDGASAHYAANVRAYLDETFQDRWIGRGGAVPWPPRSPDFNPLDFFLWGRLKNEVYRQPVSSPEELIARIHAALCDISPTVLRDVLSGVVRRAQACLEVEGGHVEPYLTHCRRETMNTVRKRTNVESGAL